MKRVLSSIAVALLGALLVLLKAKLAPYLTDAGMALFIAPVMGFVHWLNAWGAPEQVVQKLDAKAAS